MTAVGVHIRRQGFTVLGDDNGMDFFMAAIVYMRQKYHNANFYIFSDDIDYVKEKLGASDDIFYVDAMNGYYGDIEEFICLTKCNHYILTRRSSYGRMAEILNPNEGKTSVLFGVNTWNDSEERFHFISQEEVPKLCRLFHKKEIRRGLETGCIEGIDDIIKIGLDSGKVQMEERKAIILKRAKLYAKSGEYGKAVHLCRLLEDQYGENKEEFHLFFAQSLCGYGAIRESLVEFKYLARHRLCSETAKKHYIIVQFGSYSSQYLSEMQMLGLILGRMGNDVSFVFKRNQQEVLGGSENSGIKAWEDKVNGKWMDRVIEKGFSICRFYYGYPCYNYADIFDGVDSAFNTITEKHWGKETVVIGRDPKAISPDIPFRKVFVDFSEPFDEAYLKDEVGIWNIGRMYGCADIVVTRDKAYAKKGQQVIQVDSGLVVDGIEYTDKVVPYYGPTVYTDDYLDIALKIDAACWM